MAHSPFIAARKVKEFRAGDEEKAPVDKGLHASILAVALSENLEGLSLVAVESL